MSIKLKLTPQSPTGNLQVHRPTGIPEDQWKILTKYQQRQSPDPYNRDISVNYQDYPQVDFWFHQVKHKVAKNGEIFGIEIEANGKCART